jgi:hypothetical protein
MVTDYYQNHIVDKTDPDGDHGGASFMKALEANGCIKDGRVKFETQLESYEMCERRYHCVEN